MKIRVLLLAALIVGGGVALPGSAAHADTLGGIDVVPGKGNAETLISVVTERGCSTPAKRVSAVLYGKGLPAKGQIVVAPSEFLFSTTRPMELPLSNAFVIYAQRNSTGLQGTYRLKVLCTDRIGITVLDEFATTMNWRTPGGSLKNIEKATFTAKSTAGVVAKAAAAAKASTAPASPGAPGAAQTPGSVPPSAAADPTPGPGGVLPDVEAPDGSNPGVEGLVDAAAQEPASSSSDNSAWYVVGFSILALLVAAALWFRGRRATS